MQLHFKMRCNLENCRATPGSGIKDRKCSKCKGVSHHVCSNEYLFSIEKESTTTTYCSVACCAKDFDIIQQASESESEKSDTENAISVTESELREKKAGEKNIQALREGGKSILLETRRKRNRNTNASYGPRQKEYIQYMKENFPALPPLAHEMGLANFLKDRVIGRSRRNGDGREIGQSSIKSYVSAVTDLWRLQQSLAENSNPNPRQGKLVKDLLRMIGADKVNHAKRTYKDRGNVEIRQRPMTEDEKIRLHHHFMARGDSNGLRDYMAATNMRSMALRGEHMRKIELPDMFLYDVLQEKHARCNAIVTVLNEGKTNQFGNIEFGATYRSKEVSFCAHGAVGLWLFNLFHMIGHPPCFSTPRSWYDIKLFPKCHNDLTSEVPYETHRASFNRGFDSCGIQHCKSTHYFRGEATRECQGQGVKRSDIQDLGRWERGSMDNCYAMDLPIPAMRAMAGFSPHHNNFFVKRDVMEVPPLLVKKIFPFIESEELEEKEKVTPNKAKLQFMKLLRYLRRVILQDACFLIRSFPRHPVFSHEIFHSDDFLNYQSELLVFVRGVEDPTDITLSSVIPEVMKVMVSKVQEVSDKVSSLIHLQQQQQRHGMKPFSIHIDPSGTDVPRLRVSTASNSNASEAKSRDVELYRMDRSVVDVKRLWREWSVGLDGRPAIKRLEAQRVLWRVSGSEKTFYSRRLKVIKLVSE